MSRFAIGDKPLLRISRRVATEVGVSLPESSSIPTTLTLTIRDEDWAALTAGNHHHAFTEELAEIATSLSAVPTRVELVREEGSNAQPLSITNEPDPPSAHHSIEETPAPSSIGHPAVSLRLGDKVHLVVASMVIGRSSSCDLVLRDSEASRRHAEVRRDDQGLRVRDLGSTNGTRVNGIVIADWTTLVTGDAVSIGATQITVVDE